MPVKTNIKISTLAYVIVYVKDTKVSIPFYRDTLGMTLKLEDEGWVEFETGNATFCLHGTKENETVGVAANAARLPLPVFSVEDFWGTIEALKSAGVKFEREPMKVCEDGADKLGMSTEFKDPDGNLISVFGFVSK